MEIGQILIKIGEELGMRISVEKKKKILKEEETECHQEHCRDNVNTKCG